MRRVEWVNALRGLAALLVIVAHFGVLFWANQQTAARVARAAPLWTSRSDAPAGTLALAALPVDFGALGVALFFLISGYVIAISLRRYSRRAFVVGRLMRILPTYMAGYLLLCLVVLLRGDPDHELSAQGVLIGLVPGLHYLLGVDSPIDGIVWTLIVELLFYVVCVLAHRRLAERWWMIALVAVGCVGLSLLGRLGTLLAPLDGLEFIVLLACPFIPVMLVGTTLSALHDGRIRRIPALLLIAALTTTYLGLSASSTVDPHPLVYRLSFVAVIVVFSGIAMVGPRWRRRAIPDFFARISYPLYVSHEVIGLSIISLLVSWQIWPVASVAVALGVVLLLATGLHVAIESPTHRLGQRWARRLDVSTHVSGTH